MTLFETIGAILAGLVALAIAAWGLTTAFSSLKLSETEQGIITLRMQTQHMFSGTDFTGLDNTLAIKSGIAPQVFVKGNRLINPWGGNVTLTATPANATFSMELTQVPQNECTKLARFQPDAWVSVTVNGTEASSSSLATISNSCTKTNSIKFTSR